MPNNILWETVDHIKEDRSADWFWIVGIVALAVAVLAVFFNNTLFALLVLLATFAAFMIAHTEPRLIQCEINRKGIRIEETLYPYSSLESFWIIDEDGYDRDRILIKSKKMLMPIITIPLGSSVNIEEIREYLLEHLEEEEMTDPVAQRFMDWVGF